MTNKFQRTELLLGNKVMERLSCLNVIVFGVGGVGGYVIEALVRSGVGKITIVDNDTVSESNINRQIIATMDTIGKLKVDVMEERIHSIYPECVVSKMPMFVTKDNINEIDFSKYDYVVDAIDTVSAKIAIIEECSKKNILIISAMGAGNKLDPTAFRVADINQTEMCPLAKVMRYELRKRGIKHLKCVYSKEAPVQLAETIVSPESKKVIPGSISYMPSICGLMIASEVISDIKKEVESIF